MTFSVPFLPAGAYPIKVTDGTAIASAAATFTVTPLIQLNHASGPAGTPITATLTGFAPNTGVTITFGGTTVTSGRTALNGTATLSFFAPPIGGRVDGDSYARHRTAGLDGLR